MTEETVNISINIKVGNGTIEIQKMIELTAIEESVHSLALYMICLNRKETV